MDRSCSQNGRGRSDFKILTGKRPPAMARRRWEDNIRMDLTEIGINMRNRLPSKELQYQPQGRRYLGRPYRR
jgi:hypothetical protein